jgi:hypothetical protein
VISIRLIVYLFHVICGIHSPVNKETTLENCDFKYTQTITTGEKPTLYESDSVSTNYAGI